MRKLLLLVAVAVVIASIAALTVPASARAAESPLVRARIAVSTCLAERQADPAAFRTQYGTGRWRLNALVRCVVLTFSGASVPAPPPPPDPDPPGGTE